MNRKQRRAAGRSGSGASLHGPPRTGDSIAALLADASAQHRAGAFAKAERQYRRILALTPDSAETHGRLGAALMAQGKIGDAVAQFERACALEPDRFEALANLAQAYAMAGNATAAARAAADALSLADTPQTRALFAQCARRAHFTNDGDGRLRRLALRALIEGWTRPRELTAACLSLIRLNPVVTESVSRANAAWPRRLAAAELFGTAGAAALGQDALLCRLLASDPVPDIGFERFLTSARAALLTLALAEDTAEADALEFYAALAQQCFITDHVYGLTDGEAEKARALQSALVEKLQAGAAISPLWPLAVGAYGPLVALSGAARMSERAWPQPVAAVIARQINEPDEERRIAATIPALTPITDEVSRAVRQQYEEHPYPRWIAPAAAPPPAGGATPDVLIAGCGTGLSAVTFAREMPRARVLAVDLSLASLSYARRMAQSLGAANIEFAQADILELGGLNRQFDFIDASGVLHHLADPWRGWRVLLTLLRPAGTMQVGLYSEAARPNVVAARALIAQRGYRPTASDIRRCREEIATSDDPLLRSLTASSDFYTASECRDLLFHVQEHRVTLPAIKAFIAANALRFTGFLADPAVLRAFAARYPAPAALTDLDRWHEFETALPDTFAGMYQFQVTKAR